VLLLAVSPGAADAATERVSVSSAGVGGNASSGVGRPAASADGRFVAFVSRASNLVPGDTNARQDVFVRDRRTDQTERVSVDSAGAQASGAWWDNEDVAINADGRFVAFIMGMPDPRGTPYRLLFRVLASHPEELQSLYEDTVAPIVDYDARYGFDLTETLETYLQENCNMNATATAMCAHRHTVAHRLDRVKRLTRLDPLLYEDLERLGLGLKIYRITSGRRPRS
jgi:PucR C-terminal helix-turn-helix domain